MDADGTDQVQNVSMAVGGEIYMLGQVEAVEYIQKVGCSFGVNVNIKFA